MAGRAAVEGGTTRASSPVTKAEAVRLLEHTELFGALTLSARRAVAAEMTRHELRGGRILFRAGEPAGAMFVVIRGRLQVLGPEGDAVVAEIAPGQVVGELALLSGSPRNATVRAARDTSLLRLDAHAFDRLVAARPAPLLTLVKTIMERLGKSPAERQAPVRSIAVVAAGPAPGLDLVAFGAHLSEQLRAFGTVELVDAEAMEAALGVAAEVRGRNGDRDAAVAARLDAIERANDRVVYVGAEGASAWRDRCLREADLILLVARADGDPTLARHETAAPSCTRRHLVLVHPPGAGEPRGTVRWLEPRPNLVGHHHVRAGRA
ncbi:MAG TPA: cyclic nucleotide-binding domain-containing protein, partial [Acidimicrobiales bacterium]|nr:cyclic nucleotide-binding domain-containing protein [Acidimicrobiales bacterium]